MRVPTHAEAYQVLLLQAADEGRGPVLFGESLARARTALLPFMVGDAFPSVYLEHPLMGEPFLDVTVLYKHLTAGTRIDSDLAVGTEGLIDWWAGAWAPESGACFGFEIDASNSRLPLPAVHCQPRTHTELVEPYCAAIGEPERARRYLEQAARMPKGWELSYFGLFRGRPGSPLRVCGYIDEGEKRACAQSPTHVAEVFEQVGFGAWHERMLRQVSALLTVAPGSCDFQFDVWPDGSLGDTFAIDVQFGIEQPAAVRSSFETGPAANVLRLLAEWGVTDERWRQAVAATFARAIDVVLDDGTPARYGLTLMPQWLKVRWVDGELQPAKLYHLANGGLVQG